jgi:hypothetical protein
MHALEKLAATGWTPRQIVDAGAWKGTWKQECMTLYPDAQYMLVDPLPLSFSIVWRTSSRRRGSTGIATTGCLRRITSSVPPSRR